VQYGQKDGQQSDAATTPSGQVQVVGVTGTSPPQFLHSSEKPYLQQFLGPQQLSRPSSSQAQIKSAIQPVAQHVLPQKESPRIQDGRRPLRLPGRATISSPQNTIRHSISEYRQTQDSRSAGPQSHKRGQPCHSFCISPPPKRAAITQDGESGRPDRRRHPSPALSSTSDAASHHQPSAPIMDQIDDVPLHSHDDRTPPTDPSPVYIPPHRRDSAVPQSEMGKLATYLAGDAAASSYPQPSSTPKPAGSNPYSGDGGRRTRSRASRW